MSDMDEVAKDILKKLEETDQIYIVGHDMPVSISRLVSEALDAKRRALAAEFNVPEIQLEFEDVIAILTGMIPKSIYKRPSKDAHPRRG